MSAVAPFLALTLLGLSGPSALAGPATAPLQSPAGSEAEAEQAFARSVAGDRAAVAPAFEAYGRLLEARPDQALWLCRYGSLSTMKGRDAAVPADKLAHVQRGLDAMGRAVALAPEDPAIRFTRASTCVALPEFFRQTETALEDCQQLERLFGQAPGAYPKAFQMQTRLLRAQALTKAGRGAEARPLLEQVLAEAPGTAAAESARSLLK